MVRTKKQDTLIQKRITNIAAKLFAWHVRQPEENFFKLHLFDQDWYRALAQVGRRFVFKFKSDYKFNDKHYHKELFGFDKNRVKNTNHSNPVVYNKIKKKGKYVRRNESRNTETDSRKL